MRIRSGILSILWIEVSTILNKTANCKQITGGKMAKNIRKPKLRQRTVNLSIDDRFLALEESCKLTGLSFEEFLSVMKAFTKCSEGHMAFFLGGGLTLCFEARGGEIILNFEVANEKTAKTVEHRFSYSEVKMLYTRLAD
jgi:hypothetical protein